MRGHIFNAGPSCLPVSVLEQLAQASVEYDSVGMSIFELSHRSKTYVEIASEAVQRLRALLGVGDDFDVLFLTGGASTQFAMLPLNLLNGRSADYVLTGSWSVKALAEARRIGRARAAASGESDNFSKLPERFDFDPDAAYVHLTSNNTICGTEWFEEPDTGDVPLVCDVSSDFLSRPLDMSRYAMLYAGAQKNLGPAGVSVVMIRKGFLPESQQKELPIIWDYRTHIKKDSAFNTPPVFAVFAVGLVLQWIEKLGGLAAMEERNKAKADLLYGAIDGSEGFYEGTVAPGSRSRMNVTFRLGNRDLEAGFLSEATAAGLLGLKGHRSVGGLRASLYNAVELESVQALVDFMAAFRSRHA